MYYYQFDNETYGDTVQSYQLLLNGSYNTVFTNKTVVQKTLQAISNTTAGATHAWVASNGYLNAYWSPPYWDDLSTTAGIGYYWSGTAWVIGNYSLTVPSSSYVATTTTATSSSNYTYLNVTTASVLQYNMTKGLWLQYKNANQTSRTRA